MRRALPICIIFLLGFNELRAQIISEFTWEVLPVTNALIGPNANSASSSATISAGGVSGTKGLNPGLPLLDVNLTFSSPSTLAIFDALKGIDISVDFKKKENQAIFFIRDASLEFGIAGSNLYVNFLYSNGTGGSVAVSSGNIVAVVDDNLFHTYRFTYDNASGVATVKVDGTIKYTNTGIAGRSLYWAGSGNVIIGKVMDATGGNLTILDNFIISNPGSILPVRILSFSGELKNGEVTLNWSSGSEDNTQSFGVERSSGDGFFTSLYSIPVSGSSAGSREYTYTDMHPALPDSYYRLAILGRDGKLSYSPFVNILTGTASVSKPVIYPNPASDHIWIQMSNIRTSTYRISVFDTEGRPFGEKTISTGPGSHLVQYNLPVSGRRQVYLIRLTGDEGTDQTYKIMKY